LEPGRWAILNRKEIAMLLGTTDAAETSKPRPKRQD
jgi:hypothetical protein